MKHAPNCMIGRMEWQNTRMHEMGCTCGAALRDTPERSGTARKAPSSEGPQGAARLPMTGDGAVVLRKWEYHGGRGGDSFSVHAINEHNALIDHAVAQAAEIERLTRERGEAITAAKDGFKRLFASEARNADLLKALKPFAEIALSSDDEPNGPDMIDAPDLAITPTRVRVARTAIAAAKGETV